MTFQIDKRNFTSLLNSTTTPLSAGATFTGEWENVSAYDSIIVAPKTDQDGTYTVQFSPDGVNVDSTLTRYYRTADINPPHRFTITRDYARVTFENTSASDQTYLRLQTTYGEKTPLNAPLDGVLSQDFDALPTRPSDYNTEVALGLRQGKQLWNKFGYNPNVPNSATLSWIWAKTGAFTRMTSADTLDIYSTSANDANGGTGTNSVVIYGVDENWNEQTEVIALGGLVGNKVTTTNQWLGVNRVAMFLCGSGEVNAGDITVETSTGANVQAFLPAGEGVTQQCLFFIPAKTQFIAEGLYVNVNKLIVSSPKVTVKFWVYSAVSNGTQEVFRVNIDTSVENFITVNPSLPFPIGEKSLAYMTATSDQNNTVVTARFSGVLIKDNDA